MTVIKNEKPLRVTTVDIRAQADKPIHITLASDLHVENANFPVRKWKRFLQSRAQLPNSYIMGFGDLMDLVVPVDMKRHRPSVRDEKIAARDDWLDAAVDMAVDRLTNSGGPCPQWLFITPGNHEDEFLKRHGTNTTRTLAHAIGCKYGGYSGYVRVRRIGPDGRQVGHHLVIGYHHGAWGGKYAKGYNGALTWFSRFEQCDLYVYGHCHNQRVDPEVRYSPLRGKTGEMDRREVFFVNMGSWVSNFHDDPRNIHYSERGGYAPSRVGSPMITWSSTKENGRRKKTISVTI